MHPAFGANWKNRIAMLFCSANHERVGQIHFYLWPDYRSDRAAALVGIRQRLAGPTSRGHSLLWQGEFQFSFPHRYLPAYQRPSNYSALAVPKMRRTGGPSASAQAGQSNWKVIRFQMLNPFPSPPCPISSPPGSRVRGGFMVPTHAQKRKPALRASPGATPWSGEAI